MKQQTELTLMSLAIATATTTLFSAQTATTPAVRTSDFLDSIGIVTTFPDRGQPLDKTIDMINYVGFRWVRAGIEGVRENGPTTVQTFLDLHHATGVKFNWGLVSSGTNIEKLLVIGRILAKNDALIAFEGNNEPNNWGVTYQGEAGGGHNAKTWIPVAKLQRDLYAAVKADPLLNKYPVWSICENGAQVDNTGLQFLTIPEGANTVMPAGTKYADAANVHNYIDHPNSPKPADNKTWNASSPGPDCKVDGLYGNYGKTWMKHFPGYSQAELEILPRVTTETGCTINSEKGVTEEVQGLNILSLYLDQFKRGYSHTSVYLLRDRTDEGGNQSFGLYERNYKPRKAAVYLHNLTTILADKGSLAKPGSLAYAIFNPPDTVHDLLLQHSNGTFQLVVWDERVEGHDLVTIDFGSPCRTATVYDPTVGTEAVQTLTNVSSLKLVMDDHPVVITISK